MLQRADGAVVFRVDGGATVKRLVVETGVQRDGRVEIKTGLAPGEVVVTRGHSELTDGSVVRLRGADGGDVAVDPEATQAGAHATP